MYTLEITPELLKSIGNSTVGSSRTLDNDSLFDTLAFELALAQKIILSRNFYLKEHERITKECGEKLSALSIEQKKILDDCRHWITKYHPDPAGGSDSYTTCEICGKEIT